MAGEKTTIEEPDDLVLAEGTTRPFLFLVLEANRPLAPGARFDLAQVGEIVFRRGERGHTRERGQVDGLDRLSITIQDAWMSSEHARLVRRGASWVLTDLGSRNGTRLNGVSISEQRLGDHDVVQLGGACFILRTTLTAPPDAVLDFDAAEHPAPVLGFATLLPGLADDLGRLQRIAPSPVPVIVLGETGVGKEIIARAIHELSRRRGPFVAVNCGAIPESLVESELFGHRRGAFSGALSDREGFVRSAHGGTLFLDEIGDMRPGSQTALLRVLQEHQVVPLGSSAPIDVDVRVIAATHRPLAQLTRSGHFRTDLLARLTGFTLELPPLRARREDLGILVAAFLRRHAGARAAHFSIAQTALRALLEHRWPMNIRELQRSVEAALVLAPGERIALEHFRALDGAAPVKPGRPRPAAAIPPAAPQVDAASAPSPAAEDSDDAPSPPSRELTEVERARRDELERLLVEHGGNLAAVARVMDRDRALIRRWLQRYGIDPNRYRAG